MFNLIKMDLYRLFRSSSTWVMLFFTVAATIFSVVMTKTDISEMKKKAAEETRVEKTADTDSYTFGVFIESNEEWLEGKIRFSDLLGRQISSGLFMVLLTIFVSVFVHAEQKNGYLKNIAGQLSNRWLLAFSKLAALMVWVLCMFFTLTVTMAAAGKLCFGRELVMDSFGKLFAVLGGQYVLHMAFAALLLFLCTLSNSAALSITVGLFISFRGTAMLYFAADRVMKAVFGIQAFDSGRYAVEVNIMNYAFAAGREEIFRMMFSAGVLFAAAVCLTAVVLQKRDVR